MGQDRQDRVGAGPSVGPDGVQDARIRLSGVSTKVPVKAMRIEGPGGAKWESGANPELLPNAEYWPDPKKPGEGDLFFQPDRDLKGQKLKVLVLYANETIDSATVAAGTMRLPSCKMPEHAAAAAQRACRHGPVARPGWSGRRPGPGDVHVSLSGLGRTPAIAAAVLTDSVRGTWVYRGERSRQARRAHGRRHRPARASSRARIAARSTLFFAPYRDEAKATMTLRLIEQDGRMTVARFPGGACDPGRRSRRARRRPGSRPGPATT